MVGLMIVDIEKEEKKTLKILSKIKNREKRMAVMRVYKKIRVDFLEKPAGGKMHHIYPGGLVKHTNEVMENALNINRFLKEPYDSDKVIIAAFIHDLGKIFLYRFSKTDKYPDGNPKVEYNTMNASQESMVLKICFENSLTLEEDVISAVEFAHGGWSVHVQDRTLKPHRLFAILHAADILSAHYQYDVEEERKKVGK